MVNDWRNSCVSPISAMNSENPSVLPQACLQHAPRTVLVYQWNTWWALMKSLPFVITALNCYQSDYLFSADQLLLLISTMLIHLLIKHEYIQRKDQFHWHCVSTSLKKRAKDANQVQQNRAKLSYSKQPYDMWGWRHWITTFSFGEVKPNCIHNWYHQRQQATIYSFNFFFSYVWLVWEGLREKCSSLPSHFSLLKGYVVGLKYSNSQLKKTVINNKKKNWWEIARPRNKTNVLVLFHTHISMSVFLSSFEISIRGSTTALFKYHRHDRCNVACLFWTKESCGGAKEDIFVWYIPQQISND